MKRNKLKRDYFFDFLMIGISAHIKGYRLCGLLNRTLGLDLVRTEDYKLQVSADSFETFYQYKFLHDEQNVLYRILSNNGSNGLLIHELSFFDYYLILQGSWELLDTNQLLKDIKISDHILTASVVNPNSLNSKNNLMLL